MRENSRPGAGIASASASHRLEFARGPGAVHARRAERDLRRGEVRHGDVAVSLSSVPPARRPRRSCAARACRAARRRRDAAARWPARQTANGRPASGVVGRWRRAGGRQRGVRRPAAEDEIPLRSRREQRHAAGLLASSARALSAAAAPRSASRASCRSRRARCRPTSARTCRPALTCAIDASAVCTGLATSGVGLLIFSTSAAVSAQIALARAHVDAAPLHPHLDLVELAVVAASASRCSRAGSRSSSRGPSPRAPARACCD